MANPAFLPAFAPQPVGAAVAPTEGDETLSATQEAAYAGTLRNPDGTDVHVGAYPLPVPQMGSDYPFQQPAGVVTRPTMHPTPTLNFHDVNPVVGGDLGTHGEIVQTASTPNGEQTAWGSNPKTWRAEPAAWDADVYAGWTPTTYEGDA